MDIVSLYDDPIVLNPRNAQFLNVFLSGMRFMKHIKNPHIVPPCAIMIIFLPFFSPKIVLYTTSTRFRKDDEDSIPGRESILSEQMCPREIPYFANMS
jgi:hypothetical protein